MLRVVVRQFVCALPRFTELRSCACAAAGPQVLDGNCMERETQVVSIAPVARPREAFQARPILHCCVRIRHGYRHRRRPQLRWRQLVDPLYTICCESVLIHPVDQRCDIGWIPRGKRFHSLEQLPEFFLIELPIKIQAEQVIAERNIGGHLELLRKAICGGEVIAVHCIVQ